jgi:hypothetical protein
MGRVLIRRSLGSYPPYTTSFPLTENPISESGRWVNGLADGLDWANCRVNGGVRVYGTTQAQTYSDSTAVLTGTWAANQQAQATVSFTDISNGEVELRLRSTLNAHVNSGYELNYTNGYAQIVRWNGDYGDFDVLASNLSSALADGDIIKATISTVSGDVVIVSYVNGSQRVTFTDTSASKILSGNPGIGFYDAGGATLSAFGLSSFEAIEL